ncbi:MAG: rhodanese-like domain-containing protein [Bryobacteraceae bacterium]
MKKRLLYTTLGLSLALGAQQTAPQKGNPQSVTLTPGFLKLVDDAKSRVTQIDIESYKKMVAAREPHVLVDTREDSEWATGHTAGAVHLSKGIIERDIETRYPDKTTKLVLYCGGGARSALAADNLQKMGYTNVMSLDGGWRVLRESGLPIEK